MENLELILSVAGTALGLLITTITFLSKFIKNAKLKKAAESAVKMLDFANKVVADVEVLKAKSNGQLTSETKKAIALNAFEALCVKAGVVYDGAVADKLIEDVVTLTKTVNARDKDIVKLV